VELHHLFDVISHRFHCLPELLPKSKLAVVVNGNLIIDVPLVQEVTVVNVGAVVFLQKIGAVFGGAVGYLECSFGEAVLVHCLNHTGILPQ